MPRLIAVFVFAFLASAAPAHAYLDPGSGSMLLQLILGSLATFFAFAGVFWQKLKGIFVRRGSSTLE